MPQPSRRHLVLRSRRPEAATAAPTRPLPAPPCLPAHRLSPRATGPRTASTRSAPASVPLRSTPVRPPITQGQSQTITNDAPVWVRIGAASNVTVSVNGGGVLLPQAPTTYNLTFSQA